ncbi:MAG: hypothetical protein R3C55_05885 [Parvularculaceae bacterium]
MVLSPSPVGMRRRRHHFRVARERGEDERLLGGEVRHRLRQVTKLAVRHPLRDADIRVKPTSSMRSGSPSCPVDDDRCGWNILGFGGLKGPGERLLGAL